MSNLYERALERPFKVNNSYSSYADRSWIHLVGNSDAEDSGWKFRLSVDARDLPKAWDQTVNILARHANLQARAANPALAQKFSDPSASQAGKMITIYALDGMPPEKMMSIMREIDQAFKTNDIRKGVEVKGDRKVHGSEYMSYRNDGGSDNYISANQIKELSDGERYNPTGVEDPFKNFSLAPPQSLDSKASANKPFEAMQQQRKIQEGRAGWIRAPGAPYDVFKLGSANGIKVEQYDIIQNGQTGREHMILEKDPEKGFLLSDGITETRMTSGEFAEQFADSKLIEPMSQEDQLARDRFSDAKRLGFSFGDRLHKFDMILDHKTGHAFMLLDTSISKGYLISNGVSNKWLLPEQMKSQLPYAKIIEPGSELDKQARDHWIERRNSIRNLDTSPLESVQQQQQQSQHQPSQAKRNLQAKQLAELNARIDTRQSLNNFHDIDPEAYFDKNAAISIEKTATVNARQAVAGEEIVTVMKDGHVETKNTAKQGDYVVTNPDGEKYIVPGEKFLKKYQATDTQGVFKPSGGPVDAMILTENVKFKAPWGEDMSIKAGGVLVRSGPNDIYGIQPEEFKNTYSIKATAKNISKSSDATLDTVQQQHQRSQAQRDLQAQQLEEYRARTSSSQVNDSKSPVADISPEIKARPTLKEAFAQGLALRETGAGFHQTGRGVGVAMGVYGLYEQYQNSGEDFANRQTRGLATASLAANTGAVVADTVEIASAAKLAKSTKIVERVADAGDDLARLGKASRALAGVGKAARIAPIASIGLTVAAGAVEGTIGYKTGDGARTARAAGSTVGGVGGALAGGALGAKGGAVIGGTVGAFFGGVGAVPGTAIGAFVGGLGGAIYGGFKGAELGGKGAERLAGKALQAKFDERLNPALKGLNDNKTWVNKLDRNHDGKIDMKELRKTMDGQGIKNIAQLDGNHDGTVTARELSDRLNQSTLDERREIAIDRKGMDKMGADQLRKAIQDDNILPDSVKINGKEVSITTALKDPAYLDKVESRLRVMSERGDHDYSRQVAMLQELKERQSGQLISTNVPAPVLQVRP